MTPLDPADIVAAARTIREGGLVVFPTETVYGLGVDATNAQAARRVFEVKGRPPDNPLIVHIASTDRLRSVAQPGASCDLAEHLLRRFAPGPITVVVPKAACIPGVVTAGLDTVAVRVPRHPVARRLIEEADVPIAAPSANRSGEPSPTTIAMARHSLGDRADRYLDGGPCDIGIESTVVSVAGNVVTILRPGAISAADIERETPGITAARSADLSDSSTGSPGLRHRHYQPRARVVEVTDGDRSILESVATVLHQRNVALSIVDDARDPLSAVRAIIPDARVREYRDAAECARHLYRWFTELDSEGADTILVRRPESVGIGEALRDRLCRASGGTTLADWLRSIPEPLE
ncbi:MAG: threonylcarbamoyl-AMP synthase [Spirochaetaceae bacterium]|nr:MAG: threonylcarbamoyl-AMP synthase [Spirochaetaceae bacterium]